MEPILLESLKGKPTKRIPFWYMRQAGRYLPEYREVRKQAGGFLNLCYTPELCVEVTLQPIKRFDMDAAIIFSDILVIPQAMGMEVKFEEGEGPALSGIDKKLSFNEKPLAPVYEAIKRTRATLAPEKALIGFAGSPWTVACYMIQGKSDGKFDSVKLRATQDRKFFTNLIQQLIDAITQHCSNQIKAGADVIQLFDSWAGVLNHSEFQEWCIEPTRQIVSNLKSLHPNIPIIGFPRESGKQVLEYVQKTGVNGVNIDGTTDLTWAATHLQPHVCIQGNLDNQLLLNDLDAALKQTAHILDTLSSGPFIFNLGHGILQHTPIEYVKAVSDFVKNYIPKTEPAQLYA